MLLHSTWLRNRLRCAKKSNLFVEGCVWLHSDDARNFGLSLVGRILFFPPGLLVAAIFLAIVVGQVVLPQLQYSDWTDAISEDVVRNAVGTRFLVLGNVELLSSDVASPLSIWDSDRFTAGTFSRAVELIRPHAIIFVGDIFHVGMRTDQVDVLLARFHEIFNIENSSEDCEKLVFLDETDGALLNGACIDSCPKAVGDFFNSFVPPPCKYFQRNDAKILFRRFYSTFDKIDDPNCTAEAAVRIVVQSSPIVNPTDTHLAGNVAEHAELLAAFALGRQSTIIVRDFAPQVVFSSRARYSSVSFCSNCLTLGMGGTPMFPIATAVPVVPGGEPLTIRLPSKTDGGGRGGSQPHIHLPPVSYHLSRSSSTAPWQAGFAVAIIDSSTSTMTYFVLWNYNRAIVIKCYKFLIFLVFFRLCTAAILWVYFRFDAIVWWLSDRLSRRWLHWRK